MASGRISTDISSHVLLTQIASAIDSERPDVLSSSGFAGRRPFIGRVAGNTFRIQRRHANRNGLAPQLHGKAHAQGRRTNVEYQIGMNRKAIVLLAGYFALVVCIGLALSAGPKPVEGQLPPVLWAAGALLVGVLLVLLGRAGWTDDVIALEAFLKDEVRRAEIAAASRKI